MEGSDRKIPCFGYRGVGSTAEGSAPLRNPFTSASSLLQNSASQINNQLPQNRKRKKNPSLDDGVASSSASCSSYTPSFTPSSSLPVGFTNASSFAPKTHSPSKKKKVFPEQKNTLLNHFFTRTSQPKKEIVTDGNDDVQFICKVKRENGPCSSYSQYTAMPVNFQTNSGIDSSTVDDLRRVQVKIEVEDQVKVQAKDQVKKIDVEDLLQIDGNDPYGLLGLDQAWLSDDDDLDEQTGPDLFCTLPEHILENIFAHLPLMHLLLDVALVCTRFKDVIFNDKFLVWKKRYHWLKGKRKETVMQVDKLFMDLKLNEIKNVLTNLPRCLVGFRRTSTEYQQEMHVCLKQHSKYTWALKFLSENVADCLPNSGPDQDPDSWLIVGALVALSDNISDVTQILKAFSRSSDILKDVIEALYCLATYLHAVTTYHKALYGPHYYVFYALYLFENEWQAKVSHIHSSFYDKGQQNILKYSEGESNLRLTHEQMRIVNHRLLDRQVIKVVAFAGTGKTSTLIQFAKLRQGLKFLLIVYNKAAQMHASRVFPCNVECRTMNSIAFNDGPGHKFKKNLTSKVRPLDIMPFLEKKDVKMDHNTYARHVLTAIEKYMGSDDPCLTLAHVLASRSTPDEEPLTDDIALVVLRDAEKIWAKMSDPNDWEVRALHDTYLKLYQLESPVWEEYSCVMIDEAQDCTPAMLDIILSQSCPKILVGDPHQQIYSFRGAINALENVPSTHTYYLTQSFRFGPQIAYVAHCTLALLKNVTNKTLVGGKQKSDVMGGYEGQLAIIARGNATLFNEAVRLLCKGTSRPHEPHSNKVKAAFVGGLSTYNLDQLVDIYNLMKGSSNIKDRFIKRFSSFRALQMYAKKAKDQELHGKVKLVLQHEDNIPNYVETITKKCSRISVKDANVIFTTAHKAKGLEFDTVCLTDDFSLGSSNLSSTCIIMKLLTQSPTVSVEEAAEYNILYVALTRAKKCLLLSETANLVLRACQESFEVLTVLENSQETCLVCGNVVAQTMSKSFALYKKPFRAMSGRRAVTGLYCNDCAGPNDLEDATTGFVLMDKTRHAYINILGSLVKERSLFPFDGLNVFLDFDMF